ncbi:MAG: hypothetical protein SA378_07315 [Sedimentibacter sp.]|uniref:hypothetical protein n=1 Tax=Sedimentibacter sp. TaxID=1960295 RepID=UPI002980F62B|nr:hypothetical protein [Sedimentibacter sp.]MDW5299928.1 hypothetical protein [Sedimentibacter sp.]
MHKKSHKKVFGKKFIISIVIISTFSLMGVGYAFWTQGLFLETKITTASIFTTFKVDEKKLPLENCESFNMKVIDDSNLKIEGYVYPSFKNDIPIVIENQGTIPSKFSKLIIENDGEITKHKDISTTKNKFTPMSKYVGTNDVIDMNKIVDPNNEAESFTLNISASDSENNNINKLCNYYINSNVASLYDEGEIGRLENKVNQLNDDISRLKEEIREYDKVKKYNFFYKLLFEQGI